MLGKGESPKGPTQGGKSDPSELAWKVSEATKPQGAGVGVGGDGGGVSESLSKELASNGTNPFKNFHWRFSSANRLINI